MDEKREAAGESRREGVARRKAERAKAKFAERLNDILIEGASGTPDDLIKAARAVGDAARSSRSLQDLVGDEQPAGADSDERLDAVGEDRLRDELLGRLVAVSTRLEQAGVVACPQCGRVEPDRAGLERLGGLGAKAAAEGG